MNERSDDMSFADRHPSLYRFLIWVLAIAALALAMYIVTAELAYAAEPPSGGAVAPLPNGGGAEAPMMGPSHACSLDKPIVNPKYGANTASLHVESTLRVTGGPVNWKHRVYLARSKHAHPLDLPGIVRSSSVDHPNKTTMVTTRSLDGEGRALRRALAQPLFIVIRAIVRDVDGTTVCTLWRAHRIRPG